MILDTMYKVAVSNWLQERERERGMCHGEGSSVPKLHLILEECVPGAHSNQT